MKRGVLFILATHGDEGYSINILKRIEKKYPKKRYSYDWIVGNPLALKQNVRFLERDLNRAAPGNPTGSKYESRRAAEIMELGKNYDFIIDIHGATSNVGIVTIIPYPTMKNLFFASILPIKRNIIWYAEESLKSGPLVQFCNCPAIEIECGPKDNMIIQKKLESILVRIILDLNHNNMVKAMNDQQKEFYVVYGKLLKRVNNIKDFSKVTIDNETFYPFLVNQYKDIACYKTKKTNLLETFIY